GLAEWLAGEAGRGDAGEGGAVEDVVVAAAQRGGDGFAGGLGGGDLGVELGGVAPGPGVPGAGAGGAGGPESFLVGEGEPDVAQQQDDTYEPGCRVGVAALPCDPGGRWEQAEFLPVAQGRGGHPGAAG